MSPFTVSPVPLVFLARADPGPLPISQQSWASGPLFCHFAQAKTSDDRNRSNDRNQGHNDKAVRPGGQRSNPCGLAGLKLGKGAGANLRSPPSQMEPARDAKAFRPRKPLANYHPPRRRRGVSTPRVAISPVPTLVGAAIGRWRRSRPGWVLRHLEPSSVMDQKPGGVAT